MANLSPVRAQRVPSRAEITWLALSLALFLCLSILVSARYPFVWVDEVVYADPAVNFVTGRGFTSTTWYTQQGGVFWAANVPMYSFLLVPWLKLFGVSITSVRSIGLVYLSSFLCLSLIGGARIGLLSDRTSRFCFVGGLVGGYGMLFSYGSGRPDSLGMLAIGVYVLLYSFKIVWIRLPGFFLVGCLTPWIGLQLLSFQAVSGILLWAYLGRAFFPLLAAAGLGSLFGLVGLWRLYSHFGVLEVFMRSIQPDTGAFVRPLLSGVIQHRNVLPKDFSVVPMLIGVGILLALLHNKHGKRWLRLPLLVCVVIAASVSLGLILFGRFPTYYSWMVYLPLVIGVCHSIGASRRGTWARRIGVATCIASGCLGVFLHALNLFGCWRDRSYSHVENLVSQSVFPGERVYAEFAAYYALHPITKHAYYPEYLSAMTDGEKAALDVLVIYPHVLSSVREKVGGLWEPTGQQITPFSDGFFGSRWELGYLSVPNYGLGVYRRAGAPAPKVNVGESAAKSR
jgi:hypothetical protein